MFRGAPEIDVDIQNYHIFQMLAFSKSPFLRKCMFSFRGAEHCSKLEVWVPAIPVYEPQVEQWLIRYQPKNIDEVAGNHSIPVNLMRVMTPIITRKSNDSIAWKNIHNNKKKYVYVYNLYIYMHTSTLQWVFKP